MSAVQRRITGSAPWLRVPVWGCMVAVPVLFLLEAGTGAGEVSFTRDVMAVLSRAGCNAGACHGNASGKGGFKLSLRGQDPEVDYRWLTHESGGRRIDRVDPDRSLLLLKPTGQVAHQGGVRFRKDASEYQVLREWIGSGAAEPRRDESELVRLEVVPRHSVLVGEQSDSVALSVTAQFSDGQCRDVTSLATYEPTTLTVLVQPDGVVQRREYGEATVVVRYLDRQIPVQLAFVPRRPEIDLAGAAPNNYIDAFVFDKLRTLRIQPSEPASDGVFLRRVYLDALGVLPTADEARQFLADDRIDKRERLIDGLLARPEFADLWALRWSDVLRNEEKVLDRTGVAAFYSWIREAMADGKPIDRFVRELLRAEGSTYQNPPANFWRANRDPATRGETVARLFLGIRLQCAKCHNHPFDRWTQDDYYSWCALFSRLDYDIVKNERRDKFDKNEFVGEQIVKVTAAGGMVHPRTGKYAEPRMLGGTELGPGSYQDRLTPLAVWLTDPANRMFSRAMANFVWYHLIGRGLVEPIDDLRSTNPPVNEPLLDALADDLVRHHFDLGHLARTILNSRVYQLSSLPNDSNRDDQANFSRALIVRLPAEKLLDALSQVLDWPAEFSGHPRGIRAGQLPGVRQVRARDGSPGNGDRFLRTFGKPERLLACECERSNETSLTQAFVLISSAEMQERLEAEGNRLDVWSQSDLPAEQLIEELYWTALSRSPISDEREAALRLFDAAVAGSDGVQVRRAALQDLAWAVMNSKEFVFRW